MHKSFFDLYIHKNFLGLEIFPELIAEMLSGGATAAVTYGKAEPAVGERVRRVGQGFSLGRGYEAGVAESRT